MFSLDRPESEKLTEIGAVNVVCSKLTGRRDILNFHFRLIVRFEGSLKFFVFSVLIVKSLGLKNNQISLSFFPSPSLSLLNN